jgi:hypothetical protein
MGTITSRKRKDNSTAYTAQIRINRDGRTVYQESQTFDRKQVAQAWIKRRETELAEPGAIERANRKGVTIRKMIEQYLDEYEKIRPLGKTKNATLNAIKDTWLGDLEDSALTSQQLVEFAQWRMADFMRRCKGKVMVSINDHPDIRRVFEGFHFETLDIRYSNTNQRQGKAEVSGELLIMNWEPVALGGLF